MMATEVYGCSAAPAADTSDFRGFGQRRHQIGHQSVDVDAVLGRDRVQTLDAESVEFRRQVLLSAGVDLVDGDKERFGEGAHAIHEKGVHGVQPGAAVDHHQHDVRLLGGEHGLRPHGAAELFRLLRFEPTGVDEQKAPPFVHRGGDVAVARHPGRARHQGAARTRQAVEQGRLAGVRPADERHHRQPGEILGARQRRAVGGRPRGAAPDGAPAGVADGARGAFSQAELLQERGAARPLRLYAHEELEVHLACRADARCRGARARPMDLRRCPPWPMRMPFCESRST